LHKKVTVENIKFEPLGKHDRAAFHCGSEALDNYIKKQASQDVERKAAVVYVATNDGKTILGYYTLSQYSVQLNDIPAEIAKKKFAKYPGLSATLLGRLARHESMKGQGMGELLLMDALRQALRLSRQVASAAVIVDAKDDKAAAFYRKYGFIGLPKLERRLFIPMATVEALFSEDESERKGGSLT
jgi:predicted GNAT family N-acyltransferase